MLYEHAGQDVRDLVGYMVLLVICCCIGVSEGSWEGDCEANSAACVCQFDRRRTTTENEHAELTRCCAGHMSTVRAIMCVKHLPHLHGEGYRERERESGSERGHRERDIIYSTL